MTPDPVPRLPPLLEVVLSVGTDLELRTTLETAGAAAVLGFQPSTHFTGAVESRIPEPVAGHLLATLHRALAAASRRPGVSRTEVAVDATATLPDGRPGVRLTVYDDRATEDGNVRDTDRPGTTVTWQSPL